MKTIVGTYRSTRAISAAGETSFHMGFTPVYSARGAEAVGEIQRYVERDDALYHELSDADVPLDARALPRPWPAIHREILPRALSNRLGRTRRDVLPVDRPGARPASFGNIAPTFGARVDFWSDLVASDRVNGVAAAHLKLEIPHELAPNDRLAAAREFCDRAFGDRGLRYHACLHAPSPTGDQRNIHAHIVASTRPADRLQDGRWDFTVRNGRQRKIRDRWTDWMKGLRRTWADTMNPYLERAGAARRLHPGTYEDMGIAKTPSRHLGPHGAALLRMGLLTPNAAHNRRCELEWARRQRPANARTAAEAGKQRLFNEIASLRRSLPRGKDPGQFSQIDLRIAEIRAAAVKAADVDGTQAEIRRQPRKAAIQMTWRGIGIRLKALRSREVKLLGTAAGAQMAALQAAMRSLETDKAGPDGTLRFPADQDAVNLIRAQQLALIGSAPASGPITTELRGIHSEMDVLAARAARLIAADQHLSQAVTLRFARLDEMLSHAIASLQCTEPATVAYRLLRPSVYFAAQPELAQYRPTPAVHNPVPIDILAAAYDGRSPETRAVSEITAKVGKMPIPPHQVAAVKFTDWTLESFDWGSVQTASAGKIASAPTQPAAAPRPAAHAPRPLAKPAAPTRPLPFAAGKLDTQADPAGPAHPAPVPQPPALPPQLSVRPTPDRARALAIMLANQDRAPVVARGRLLFMDAGKNEETALLAVFAPSFQDELARIRTAQLARARSALKAALDAREPAQFDPRSATFVAGNQSSELDSLMPIINANQVELAPILREHRMMRDALNSAPAARQRELPL